MNGLAGLPAVDRFYARRTVAPSGCWIMGKAERYTTIRTEAGRGATHRWAYEHFVGPIPDGLVLDHLCRVLSCANPEHLEPVTQAENVARGQTPAVVAGRTGVCFRGHQLVVGKKQRECRECRAQINREMSVARLTGRLVSVLGVCDYCSCRYEPDRRTQRFCSTECRRSNERKIQRER